jgi:hypothetical protein
MACPTLSVTLSMLAHDSKCSTTFRNVEDMLPELLTERGANGNARYLPMNLIAWGVYIHPEDHSPYQRTYQHILVTTHNPGPSTFTSPPSLSTQATHKPSTLIQSNNRSQYQPNNHPTRRGYHAIIQEPCQTLTEPTLTVTMQTAMIHPKSILEPLKPGNTGQCSPPIPIIFKLGLPRLDQPLDVQVADLLKMLDKAYAL